MHYIKELKIEDLDDIRELDKLTDGIMEQCITAGNVPNYKAYALYNKCEDGTMKVIGYCTYESAEALSSSSFWSPTSLMISEFFILENYRNQGYGTELMEYILHEIPRSVAIFMNIENMEDMDWYRRFGFDDLADGSILRPEKIDEE